MNDEVAGAQARERSLASFLSRHLTLGRIPARVTGALLALAAAFHLFVGTRLTAVLGGVRYFGLTDDQMISLRYARNLVDGHGLVWNPGEPPVEGITNLLWTLWMAVGHLILPDAKVALWVVATSAVCLGLLGLLAGRLAARLAPDSVFVPPAAMVLTGFYLPFVQWTMTGWETGAAALLLLWMTLLAMDVSDARVGLDGVRRRFAVAAVVAVLLRLDTLVFVAALAGWALLAEPDRRARLRFLRDVGGSVVVVLAALTAWRVAYYGAWLPNSYVMRVGGLSLGQRLARAAETQWVTLRTHLWVLVPFVSVAMWPRPGARKSRWVIIWVAAAQMAYVFWVGGDAWEDPGTANRWIWMALPGVFALSAVGVERAARYLVTPRLTRPVGALVVAALLGYMGLRPTAEFLRFDFSQGTYFWRVQVGLHLARHLPPEAKVADWWAGTVPYFSGLHAVDLMGVSDRHIARTEPHNPSPGHNKWDYEYSIGQLRPDVVVELYSPTEEDWALLDRLGYTQGPLGVWFAPGLSVPEPGEAERPRRR